MWPVPGPRPSESVVFYCGAIKNSRSKAEAIFSAMWPIPGPRPLKSVVFYCGAIKNSRSKAQAVFSAMWPVLGPRPSESVVFYGGAIKKGAARRLRPARAFLHALSCALPPRANQSPPGTETKARRRRKAYFKKPSMIFSSACFSVRPRVISLDRKSVV